MATRDVMLFVTGITPQVITETLWGLCKRNARFRPKELHVITTAQGLRVTERRLLGDGILSRLCDEIGLSPAPELKFHVVRGRKDQALEDIRNNEDNTALANTVMQVVRSLTASKDRAVHASLSGGRKTMSFYLGYAISLYGRAQDSLYHVMVSPEFENCPDFFYIPVIEQELVSRDGKKLSSSKATIEIAEIPFLRLRDWIDEPILTAPVVDFGAITQSVQSALAKPVLVFDDDECRVTIGAHSFDLPPQSFALYRLLAETCASSRLGAGPTGAGGPKDFGWLTADDFSTSKSYGTVRFLQILDNLRLATAKVDYLAGVIARDGDPALSKQKKLQKIFNPILSRLRNAITANILDPGLRYQFMVHTEGRNPARYGLLLKKQQIQFGAVPEVSDRLG